MRIPTSSCGAPVHGSSRARAIRGPRALIGLRDELGQAMVEFVLVLPLLVTLVFVVFQLGIAFKNYLQVTDAARAGARAAATARFSGGQCGSAATAAAQNAASGLTITVACAPNGSLAPGQTFTVTVSTPYSIDLPLLPFGVSGNLNSTATERSE